MPARGDHVGPLGVVYTPPALAKAMVVRLLAPLCENATSAQIAALRVCDPAMGDGAFLVEVVRYLAERMLAAGSDAPLSSDRPRTPLQAAMLFVATSCIAGVDIDAQSVSLARSRIAALCVSSDDELANLRTADALTLDWASTFPSFDAVIANPPYIRQESLAAKAFLRDFTTYDGVADLYVYFLELAHRVLRPDGRYAFVVPNKWMTAEYGRPLRAYLAEQHSVDSIVDLSALPVFDNADAFPCVLFGSLGGSPQRSIRAVRATPHDSLDGLFETIGSAGVVTDFDEPEDIDDTELHRPSGAFVLVRSAFNADPWHIDSPGEAALLARLERSFPSLAHVIGTRWSRGVVTGCNDAFVIDRATRDVLLSSWPAGGSISPAELIRPFVKGRDLRAYTTPTPARWILLVDRGTPFDALPPAVRAHLESFRPQLEPRPPAIPAAEWSGRKPGTYAWYELQDPVVSLAKSRAPRLLYQDIQTSPLCTRDLEGEMIPDTTVWILPSHDLVLLAILNSPVYRWIAQRRFPPALNGAVRPKLQYMQRLPIPDVSYAVRREISTLVELRILDAAAPVRSDSLDAQLTQLICEAYQLSSRERALILANPAAPRTN